MDMIGLIVHFFNVDIVKPKYLFRLCFQQAKHGRRDACLPVFRHQDEVIMDVIQGVLVPLHMQFKPIIHRLFSLQN